jgi:hypothetical protein
MDPRAVLDAVVKIKIPSPRRESQHRTPKRHLTDYRKGTKVREDKAIGVITILDENHMIGKYTDVALMNKKRVE